MPKRHPFTESDDGHLVQFLAMNNPDASGRCGNKMYKTLVENPKRWPWSKSHPWQSWRERYKKNAGWFDGKIKRYLREQKAAREGEDDYMHELFGSFTEVEDEDVAEPEDPPASSSPSSPSAERIYPDLPATHPDIAEKDHDMNSSGVTSVTPPQVPIPRKGRLPSPPPPSPPVPPRQGEKRRLKRKVPDDDPFIDDSPPSPTPKQHLATRKILPMLKEGPFRNLYVQTRDPSECKGAAVRPPNRKRMETEGPSQITGSHIPTSKSVIGRKIQQQVNAVASSSKFQLPPSTSLGPDVRPGEGAETSERSRADVTEQPSPKRQKFGHPPVTDRESARRTLVPIPSSPVIFPSNNSLGNPRADNERPATRRVDLRESLRRRRIRSGKSSLLSSRGSTASVSNHTDRRNSAAASTSRRRQHVSCDEDLEFISLFERDLAGLGEQYGFALGIVKQLYMQFGSLEKTILALRALNSIMKGAQNKLYEEMQRLGSNQDDDTDDGDLLPEGVIPKNGSPRGKETRKETMEGESHATPSNKRHRISLSYKPLTTDVEDQSEYSPPFRTRARRYTKLQKEGREKEALIADSGGRFIPLRNDSREVRVSGVREIHRRATTIKRGIEPSSPLDPERERSPTPGEGEVIGLRETGGQGHDVEDGDGDTGFTPPDRYGMREPTPEVDDEKPLLKAEHKKLYSEVTLQNRDVLGVFEKGQDGDPWRGEGDWVEERFSTLKDAQEIRRQEYYRTEANAEEWEDHDV